MFKPLYIFFIVFLLLNGCTDEEPSIEPNIQIDISVFETGGAIFSASFIGVNNKNILNSGFLISLSNNPNFENSENHIVSHAETNQFKKTINTNLIYNKQYFVIAYMKISKTEYLYSDVKQFVSYGSKSPQINEISKAHILDTLLISGKYFTTSIREIKVYFDNTVGRILNANDSLIKCVVPKNLTRFDPTIKVSIYEKNISFNGFSLYKPQIDRLSSTNISLGDTLSIEGKHFDFNNDRNKIIIDNKEVTILKSSRNKIQFITPTSISFSTNKVILQSQLQEVISLQSFKVKPPVIESLNSNFRAFEIIDIIGTNFNPLANENKIYFDDNLAQILEVSRNKLKVRVPIGYYLDKNVNLSIKLMDYEIDYSNQLTLTDIWLMNNKIDNKFFGAVEGSQYFVYNEIGYVFQKEIENNRFRVLKFDPIINKWDISYVNFPRTKIKDESFSIIYNEEFKRIYFYFSNNTDNFYEYIIDSQLFELKKDYPDDSRRTPVAFSIKDKLYVGLGKYSGQWSAPDLEPFKHFWEYDIINNLWKQIPNFPGNIYVGRSNTSVFVIKNEAYIGNGATTTGMNDFWKYSQQENQWTAIADFPDARNSTSYFEYKNKGYVIFGSQVSRSFEDSVFRYEPNINEWVKLDNINNLYYKGYGLSSAYSFILKFSNSVYLGVYKYPNYDFYKADLNRLEQ